MVWVQESLRGEIGDTKYRTDNFSEFFYKWSKNFGVQREGEVTQ
jgi:hypothetical protein